MNESNRIMLDIFMQQIKDFLKVIYNMVHITGELYSLKPLVLTVLYQTLITKDNTDLEFTGNLQAFKQASSPQVDLGLQAQY